MSTICFYAQFVASKVGVNSLTVTWDVEQITRSDGTRSALVTGGATTITVGRRGLYGYRLASADLSLYDYVATAITATTTVDQQEIAAIGMVIPDESVSTRSTYSGGAVASVTGDVAGKVLGGGASTITGTGAQATISGTLTILDALWAKIQKWLRLGFRKDLFVATDHAAELAEINANTGSGVGTYTSTTDSLEAVSAGVATIGAIGDPLATVLPGSYPHNSAGDIIYRLRAIDTSNVSVNSPIDGTTITIRRGDTFACSITGLGALTGYKNLWFTVKTNLAHADSSAVIQVDSDTGLLRLYGAAATAVDGEITVDDEAGGDITITLSAAVTSTLAVARNLYYDIQIQDSTDDITTLSSGTCHIVADVTRAIS